MVCAQHLDIDAKISIIIPIYNEANVLRLRLRDIVGQIETVSDDFELIVVENGSRDQTWRVLNECGAEERRIKPISYKKRDYGAAMRFGILSASGLIIHICQIDFFDIEFFRRSIEMIISGASFVVGSRNIMRLDRRPFQRRILSRGLNLILKVGFGFKGTDTHGLKTLNRDAVMGFLRQCKMTRGQFDTELTLRAQHGRMRIHEIPVIAYELRPKKTSYWIKIFGNIRDLICMKRLLMKEFGKTE